MEFLALLGMTVPVMFLIALGYAYISLRFFNKRVDYHDFLARHGYRLGIVAMFLVVLIIIYFL